MSKMKKLKKNDNKYTLKSKKVVNKITLSKKRSVERCERQRLRFGVSSYDTYSFSYTFGISLYNGLITYIEKANGVIVRDDWELIEKHANAIKEWAEADTWDGLSTVVAERNALEEKAQNFRAAMFWLSENWQSLWW